MRPREPRKPGRILVLGTMQIWSGETRVTIARPRQRAVLGLILTSVNRLVTLEAIAEAIWGGLPPSTARQQIQADVAAIRRALNAAGLGDLILRLHNGYRAATGDNYVDLTAFDELVAQANRAYQASRAQESAQLLRTALSLWQGEPLEDIDAPYLDSLRASLDGRRMAAVKQLAAAELDLGLFDSVIGDLTPAVAAWPVDERLSEQLMTALYQAGRQADALGVARALRRALSDDHGLEPGHSLVALEQAILQGSLPLHTTARPAADTLAARPFQLPRSVHDFVGRAEIVTKIDSLVRQDGAVVLLTGPAGVGKTATAVHWAQRARDDFPDGQLFVDMDGYAQRSPKRPIDALTQLLRGLGTPDDNIPLEVDEAAALFRTLVAQRRMMLIFDNCNHPDQVRPLLPGHPEIATILTSRDQLSGLVARDGVRRVSIDLLQDHEAVELIARIVGRASASAEPQAALLLAHLCGNLPLALRVAAAQIAEQSGGTIGTHAESLRSGDLLASLAIDGDSQSSVLAAFELSYRALTPPERQLFRLLSLVPGPDFGIDTAAALVGQDEADVVSLLKTLNRAHLLNRHDTGRYYFHDLLRLFAVHHAKRKGQQNDEATVRLFEHYISRASAAGALLYPQKLSLPRPAELEEQPFPGRAEAASWLDAEHINLTRTVATRHELGHLWDAVRLADSLRGHNFPTASIVDLTTAATTAIAAAQSLGDDNAMVSALVGLARIHWRTGQASEAVAGYRRALKHAEESGWLEARTAILGNLGIVFSDLGQFTESMEHYQQALRLNQEFGWRHGEAVNLLNIGLLQRTSGNLTAAADCLRLAKQAYENIGSVAGIAIADTNLGEVLRALGRLPEAREHLKWALDRHREVADSASEAETLRCLAEVERDEGDFAQATMTAQQAIDLSRATGHKRYEAEALNTLGGIQHLSRRTGQSLDTLLMAQRLARDTGNKFLETSAMIGAASCLRDLGLAERSRSLAHEALSQANRLGYAQLQHDAEGLLETLVLSV